MSIEEITKKIAEQTDTSVEIARIQAEQLMKVQPELYPIVEAWLRDEQPPFERYGVSLAHMMKHDKCLYIHAIFAMSALIAHPEHAHIWFRPRAILSTTLS